MPNELLRINLEAAERMVNVIRPHLLKTDGSQVLDDSLQFILDNIREALAINAELKPTITL